MGKNKKDRTRTHEEKTKEDRTKEERTKEERTKEERTKEDKNTREDNSDRSDRKTKEDKQKPTAGGHKKRDDRRDGAKPADKNKPSAISCFPPNDYRELLKKQNKNHEDDELDDRPEFNLFGDNLPLIEEKFEREVKDTKLKKVFSKGDKLDSLLDKYKILERLSIGPNVYRVLQKSSRNQFLIKLEAVKALPRSSRLAREVCIMRNSGKTKKDFRKHFLKLVDRCKVEKQFNYVVVQLGGPSLLDLSAKHGQFPPSDAVRFCLQTLQAIHDVHLCHYVHRDIQPKNFVIGLKKPVVYVVNFGLSFEYYPNEENRMSILAKFKHLNRKFQPRAFHNGGEYNRWGDMESWLYMCYWFFDNKCLPWEDFSSLNWAVDVSERRVLNFKEMFFLGTFDRDMNEKSDRYLPTSLRAMRNKIYHESTSANRGPINYPFFAQAILLMKEEIDVGGWDEPFQCLSKDEQKPIEALIKHDHSESSFCISCMNSHVAKSSSGMSKRGAPKKSAVEAVKATDRPQVKKKSSDEESSSGENSSKHGAVKKNQKDELE